MGFEGTPMFRHATQNSANLEDDARSIATFNLEDTKNPNGQGFRIRVQNPQRIFYNRVSKCGSTSILRILRFLARPNKWNQAFSRIYNRTHISEAEQAAVVADIMNLTTPVMYNRHVHFINFTRFGAPVPFYVNVIRDPLDRLISAYYFARQFPDRRTPEERNTTYDDCVQMNMSECVGPSPEGFFRQIPYFCGQQEFCQIPSFQSLSEAKRNVERYYALVGLTENISAFMSLLEHIVPQYFKSARRVYEHRKRQNRHRAKQTLRKILPTNKTVETMKKILEFDYEFYFFVRHKFYATEHAINLTKITNDSLKIPSRFPKRIPKKGRVSRSQS